MDRGGERAGEGEPTEGGGESRDRDGGVREKSSSWSSLSPGSASAATLATYGCKRTSGSTVETGGEALRGDEKDCSDTKFVNRTKASVSRVRATFVFTEVAEMGGEVGDGGPKARGDDSAEEYGHRGSEL